MDKIETLAVDITKVVAASPTDDGLVVLGALMMVTARLFAALAVANETPALEVDRLLGTFEKMLRKQTTIAIGVARRMQ